MLISRPIRNPNKVMTLD